MLGIDHVQVAAPPGCEAAARGFYGGLLGLVELAKPPALRARGGVWFALGAGQQLHVGVEREFRPSRKAHPALRVAADALPALARRLADAGAVVRTDGGRCYTEDPWGNRLELVAAAVAEILTPRLRLRRWTAADAAAMAAINRDPEVTRHLNRAVDPGGFLAGALEHWAAHGFGWFALESREPEHAGRLLGFAGVGFPGFMPELAARPELGWRLARTAWGRGLGTEAATAARDDAFDRLGLPELISIIHPHNARSQRVAVKLGMTIERQARNPVLDRLVDVWRRGRPPLDAAAGGG